MTDTLSVDEQKKVARALLRLKHSIAADREIKVALQQMQTLGTAGVTPHLEMTLAEVLGTPDAE